MLNHFFRCDRTRPQKSLMVFLGIFKGFHTQKKCGTEKCQHEVHNEPLLLSKLSTADSPSHRQTTEN